MLSKEMANRPAWYMRYVQHAQSHGRLYQDTGATTPMAIYPFPLGESACARMEGFGMLLSVRLRMSSVSSQRTGNGKLLTEIISQCG